jgi:proton glutamate symport protein
MSQSIAVILGLIAGIVVGMLIGAFGNAAVHDAVDVIRPVGELWLSMLQMTVIPLVVSLLITGIASATDTAANGRLAARTLVTFLIFLICTGVASALVTPLLLKLWPVAPDAAAALRASLSPNVTVPEAPAFAEFFHNIVPKNPFKAAADGAILPLIVFSLFFGLAASRVRSPLRSTLLGFFEAVVETMLIIVNWVLWAAPVGVFALAVNVGLEKGLAVAGAIGQYVVLMCIVGALVAVAMYVVVAFTRGMSVARFARAALPAQALAISTQSSLACLPAMLTAAQTTLGVPQRVAGVVLPLAVSLFRATSPPVNLAIVLFVAHVYGVHLSPLQIAIGTAVCVVTSLGVVSLPSALSFFTTTVPISLAMGVPMELLTLLVAVEVFPDLFRTVGNVTADLAVTALIARREVAPGEMT